MRITLFLLFLFAGWNGVKGQNVVLKTPAQLALAEAIGLVESDKFDEALTKLLDILKKDPDNEEVLYYLGSCYQGMGQPEKAETYFSKADKFLEASVKNRSWSTMDMLELHQLQFQRKYAAEQAILLRTGNTRKDPVKLPSPINSGFEDYFPMLDPTATRLYFTSKRPDAGNGVVKRSFVKSKSTSKETAVAEPKESDEDIYYTERTGTTWGAPVKLPEPLNTDNNDGAACFSADGQLMVFGACGLADGVGSCDIYTSMLENGRWTNPRNLGNVVNSANWDAQVNISSDGSRIFFSSNRPGGYGDTDLYYVERNQFGEWGPPVSLGGTVNTPFYEYAPFFSQDGKTLYFSSNGHPGFGGLDIFKTTFDNGKWSIPVNMGKPLNTAKDDKYFTIGGSGEIGYFASDRDGKLSLYEIEIPEAMRPQPTIVVTGVVTNAKTNQKVGGYVMVEDIDTQELIGVSKSNPETGKYLVVLPGGRNYSVSANKEGYFFYSQVFDVPQKIHYQEIIQDITLKPIEKGTKVVINNIFFETGKATLTPQSFLELDKAIELLRVNPTMVIEVGGHTDNVGDDATNMKLSHDRAKAVREFLVIRGIAPDRVQAKGYGESNPIATNDTDEGRKANRRTEFIILEF